MNSSGFAPLFVAVLALAGISVRGAQTCDLYPIALHASQISNAAPGTILMNVLNGVGPGAFGWLTWAGSPSEPTLVTSLIAPGNSGTYVGVDDSRDNQVSIGDWVRARPGIANSRSVRDALEALTLLDISVPVWDEARGQGAHILYRVASFARIRLSSFQLAGQNRITARYLGPALCGLENRPPGIAIGGDQNVTLPGLATLSAAVTDDGLPAGSMLSVTWAQLGGPAGATAMIASPHETNTLVQFSQAGTYTFSITVNDSELSASNRVVITVNRPNLAPVAFPDSVTNEEDLPIDIVLRGSDPEGSNLVFALTVEPAHGTLSGALPSIRYQPLPDYNGPDSFAFTVSDGALVSASALVTITNLPVNDAPIAVPVEATILEDTPATVEFSGADVDGDTITFHVQKGPQHGTLTSTATNALYVPFANYHGPDSFTYVAGDGRTNSMPAAVTIQVQSVNDAPAVDVGPDVIMGLPTNSMTLAAMVSDVEFASNELLMWWSEEGAESASFFSPTNSSTGVTFPTNGVFRLRLTVTDLVATNTDEMKVTVNAAPEVFAGVDQLVTLPAVAQLAGRVTDDRLPTNYLATAWLGEGPGTIVFGDPTQTNTTASFSEGGLYTLWLVASDGLMRSSNSLRVMVNRAPVVDAGSPQVITNLFTTMTASVHDDGFPSNQLTLAWSQVSGPSEVFFTTNTADSLVTFPTNGTYVLRLSAHDTAAERNSEVTIHVNFPPRVDAGGDQTIAFGEPTHLNATVVDDGLPPATAVVLAWQILSGPGTVALGDPNAAQTEVALDKPGVYVLRLTASDSQWSVSDELTITVLPPNQAPIVSVAPALIANFPGPAFLAAVVTDDGQPEGAALSAVWSKFSGPGEVSFGSANELNTMALFDAPGIYVLTFTASDSELSTAANVFVTMNEAPRVIAGPDQITTVSNAITLRAAVSDDGLPFGMLNVTWTKAAGPGAALFTSPTMTETSVRFTAVGEYVLRLSATDSNAVSSDTVAVSVRPDGANLPPLVHAGSNQFVALTNKVILAGSVTDDDLPYGVPLVIEWSQVSGPGGITFSNSNAPGTRATFSESGVYVLQLTASDSEFVRSNQVSISVYLNNQPPVVNAGADQEISRGPITLRGAVFDDGFPTNSVLTVFWERISGPGVITIFPTNTAATEVTFSEPGVHHFRFTAMDGEWTVSDGIIVTVTGNQPPVVDAGPDLVIDLTVGTGLSTSSSTVYPAVTDGWRYGPGQPGLSGLYGGMCCVPGVGRKGLAWSGTDVYVGGGFLNAHGVQAQSLARWNGCSYSALYDPRPRDTSNPASPPIGFVSATSKIFPLAAQGREVFAMSGFFGTDLNKDTHADWMLRWSGTGWEPWQPRLVSASVAAGQIIAAEDGIYVAGQFRFQPGTNSITSKVLDPGLPVSFNLAKWDGTNWCALSEGIRGINSGPAWDDPNTAWVRAVAVAGGKVFAGGRFVMPTMQGFATNLAQWDGTNWLPVGPLGSCAGCGFDVVALAAAPNGDLFVGGEFTRAGGTTVNRIARWDGTNWSALGAGFNSTVEALAVRGPELFAGGDFSQSGTSNVFRVAKWNGTSWSSLSNGVNGPVFALAATPAGVFVGGEFTAAGGQVARGIAKWGHNELASVIGPDPVSVSAHDSTGAEAGVTLRVKSPCGGPLEVLWGVDGGAPEQTNVLANGSTSSYVDVGFTNLYSPGVHTVLATISDAENGVITFLTTVSVVSPAVASLQGTVSDDGRPLPGALGTQWELLSGPSTVTFADGNAADTQAYFTTLGTYVLRLKADDSEWEASDEAVVTVRAAGNVNLPPIVLAGTGQNISFEEPAMLNGIVSDDGLVTSEPSLNWSQVSGPGHALFNPATSSVALVSFDAPGTYVLRLSAHDGEFSTFDDLMVNVSGVTNEAPVVNAGPDQFSIVGTFITLQGTVSDDGLLFGAMNSWWSQPSGPGTTLFRVQNGRTYAVFSEAGEYVLRLSADDGRRISHDDVTVIVYEQSELPRVEILSPQEAATIASPTVITGTVSSTMLESWALEFRLKPAKAGAGQLTAEDVPWEIMASGSNNVTEEALGNFDPTLLLNGIYELKIRATDRAGRSNETEPVTVVVERMMKVGHFTLSFNDLTIPLAGLPLQVIRTYDSRDRQRGDFGVGWRLQLNNVRLQKTRHLGRGWDQSSTGGAFPIYSVEPLKPRLITITFPDNTVYRFSAQPSPGAQFGLPLTYPSMRYAPLNGTHGTLTPVFFNWRTGERMVDDQLVWGGEVPGRADFISWEHLLDPPPGTAENILYNPDLFEFTTREGHRYLISETNGLRSITDPNGNALLVTSAGLTWSNAANSATLSVVFERDEAGGITNIVDGLGRVLSYRYDANGDLVSFTDREGNSNVFTYSPRHELLTLTDALDNQVLGNSFDGAGRLVRQQDAAGNSIRFTHDLVNRIEYETNRLGHTTAREYDERGNLLRITDPLGAVSTFTYDAHDNVVTSSNAACACLTSFEYDADDNLVLERDAAGHTKRYTHNPRGQILTFTDPEGISTTNHYDANGNLIAVVDARGLTTSFSYTMQGKVASLTNPTGGTVHFTYNDRGHLTNEVDELGNATAYTVDEHGRLLSQTRQRRVRIAGAKGARGISPAPAKSHLEREPLIPDQEFYYTNTTVRFVHDANGRLRATLLPENIHGLIRYEQEYNANGQPVITTGPNGSTTTAYNALGKVASITHPDGSTETFEYDVEGHLIGHLTPRGRTSFEWAPQGQIERVTFPDSSAVSAKYDPGGRLIQETDQNGCSVTYEYDAVGNRTSVTDPLGQRTVYGFNARRTCTNVVDALGRVTSLEFDYLNRHTRITFPDGTSHRATYLGRLVESVTDEANRTSIRDYDKAGRLISLIDPAGRETRFQHDELGNLLATVEPGNRLTVHDYDQQNHRTQTVLPDKGVQTLARDAGGRVVSVTDALGGVTQLAYDGGGRVTKMIDPENHATVFGYNARGDLNSIEKATGEITAFVTDVMGRRLRATFPDGTSEESVFDAAGLLKSYRDRAGGSATFTYDCLSRLISVVDPAGQSTAIEYDEGGRRHAVTFAGRRTEYRYDLRDRVTEITRYDGAIERFEYDQLGRGIAATDPAGRTLDYSYDSADRVIGLTGPLGFNRSFTYNSAGLVASVSDSLSGETQFTRDEWGNVMRTLFANGTFTQSTYDKLGRRTAFTDERGNATGFEYDKAGRLTRWTDALGNSTTYSYDDASRLVAVVDALERRTQFSYDILQRTRLTTFADSSTRTDVYDPRGLLLSTTDEEGRTTTFGYDALGQLTSVLDALGGETRYQYDALGRIVSHVDALGRARTFQFDDAARTVVRSFPGGLTEQLSFDAIGNVIERTDFNGATTSYEYDTQRRLTAIVPDGRFQNTSTLAFTYDALGRRTSMTDGSGETAYDYDLRSRLLSKSTPQGTLNYTYDQNGNVTSVVSSNPNGATLAYEYDALDRLLAVNDPRLGNSRYSYDAVGNVLSLSKPNGLVCSYQYDARDRIASLQHGTLASYQYDFDRAGNRITASETLAAPGAQAIQRIFAYDALDRLKTESVSANASTALLDYNYDRAGNRLSRTSTFAGLSATADTYDENDRPARDTFDANGNTIAATNFNALTGIATSVFDEYDFEDRLIRRTTTLNSQPSTLTMLHNGDGQRVRKTVDAMTTHYLIDELNPTGWPQVIEELTSTNGSAPAVTRAYTWGRGWIGQDQFESGAWQPRVSGMDAMGSVRFLTDLDGSVTDHFDYDAFGNLIERAGSTALMHLYRGEQFDADLGMYYLRARYYDPDRGRFWTRDSFDGFLDAPAGQHRYAYAQNNPVNRIDPGGHYSLVEMSLVTGLAPDVRGMMDQLWSGVNGFTHGLGGGEILKAKNHASGLFVQGLVPETGVYLGRRNFFNTIQGAPFLLSHNPYTYIPEYDCFSCEKIGFGAYSEFFGSASRHPIFQFDVQSSPLYGTWQNIAAFTEALAVAGAVTPLIVAAAPLAGAAAAGLGASAATAALVSGTVNVGLAGWGGYSLGQVAWEQGTHTDYSTGLSLSDQELALRRSSLYGSVVGGTLTGALGRPLARGAMEAGLAAARRGALETGLRGLETAQTLGQRVFAYGTEFIPGNRNCLTLNGNGGLGSAGLKSLAEGQGAVNRVGISNGEKLIQPAAGQAEFAFVPFVERQTLARDFYKKSTGWNDSRIASHLRGIDFNEAVDVITISRGSVMTQHSFPGDPTGNYFGLPGTSANGFGIYPHGRIENFYRATTEVQALRSTAANVTDTWSVSGWAIDVSGGNRQFFVPQRQSMQRFP